MAFKETLIDDDENKAKESNVIQTGGGSAGGGVLTGASAGGQTSKDGKASTGFVNFQTYLDANQDKVGQSQDQLVGAVRKGRDDTVNNINTLHGSATQSLTDAGAGEVSDDPIQRRWREEAQTSYDSVKGQDLRNNDQWTNAVNAWTGQGGALDDARQLDTREGQSSALREYLGRPGYTSGEHALDSALVSADTSKFRDYRNETEAIAPTLQAQENSYYDQRDTLMEQWDPTKFEERPDLAQYGYSEDSLSALQQGLDDNLDTSAQGLHNVQNVLGGLESYLAGEDLGEKQQHYAQQAYDAFAAPADEYDYRYDLGQGQSLIDRGAQGLFDRINRGTALGQEDYLSSEATLQSLTDYIGGEQVNDRARPELEELEQRLQTTLSNNDRHLVSAGLAQSGYSDDFINNMSTFNTNDQVVSPENRVSMQDQLTKLNQAAANAWDPDVKAELTQKAQGVEAQLVHANMVSDYYGHWDQIAGQFNLDPAQLQNEVRAAEGGQGISRTVQDAVQMMVQNNVMPSNPQARARLEQLAVLTGARMGESEMDKPQIITEEPDQSPPPSGGTR